MKTSLLILLTVGTLGLSIAATVAPPDGSSSSMQKPQGGGKWLDKWEELSGRLNLDNTQREAIKTVLKKDVPDVMPLVRSLVNERRALVDIIRTVPVDEAAIRSQSAKVAAVESDLSVKRARISAEIQALLRPEQIAEFKKIESEIRAKVDERLSRIGNGGERQ